MTIIFAFIKLVRPLNVLILFISMYSIRFFYTFLINPTFKSNWHEKIDFFLFVFSTVLILAGGNVINDYFDLKADKINKPEKIVINKYIKQRFAILSHWVLNSLALIFGIYLSAKSKSFSFVFVFLFAINILWFYSVRFKRKLIIGNLIISILTASIPIICLMYFNVFNIEWNLEIDNKELIYLYKDNKLIYIYMFSAFYFNFLREIIKDIEDVTGDMRIKANTLPIKFGIKKVKLILIILFAILFIVISSFNIYILSKSNLIFNLPFYFIFLIIIVTFCLIFINKWKIINLFLKISMFIGLILPYYWFIIYKI